MTRIGLATCAQFRDLDHEDRLLLPALAALGIDAEPVVWDDDADWAGFDAIVLRSTWDYVERYAEFLAWVDEVTRVSRLLNSAATVRWNTDKHYLRALTEAGVPTVATTFLEPGDDPAAWSVPTPEVVVKPAVSAGSRDTMRHVVSEDRTAAVAQVAGLLAAGRSVMVQPYLASVDTAGETALLFFAGDFSHAIRKGPLLLAGVEGDRVEGLFVQEEIEPRTPSAAEHAVAQAALAAIPGERPLYARVDLLAGPGDAPVLLELELTEPSLFLSHSDGAAERLADAITRTLGL